MSWLWHPLRGRGQSSCFTLQRRSRHTPRPRRGRGAGGRGAEQRAPPSRAPAHPHRRPGAGGPPPANEGGPRTTAAHPSEGRAGRRTGAQPGAPRTQQNNPVLFSSGGRNARTINKTCVLLGSFGGCRRRTLAAEHRGQLRGAVSRKRGGTTTPPQGCDL